MLKYFPILGRDIATILAECKECVSTETMDTYCDLMWHTYSRAVFWTNITDAELECLLDETISHGSIGELNTFTNRLMAPSAAPQLSG